MALYAQRRDAADVLKNQARQMNHQRTRRALDGFVRGPSFVLEGTITLAREFGWHPIAIDPVSAGDFAGHKQIVAFDARLKAGGSATLTWVASTRAGAANVETTLRTGHVATTDGNMVILPTPFIFDALQLRQWITANLTAVSGGPRTLTVTFYTETVPI